MSFKLPLSPKGKTIIKNICLVVGILVMISFFGFLCYAVLGGPLPELPSNPVSTLPVDTTTVVTEPATQFNYEILAAPPADGDQKDITAKGSYTAQDTSRSSAVVATAGALRYAAGKVSADREMAFTVADAAEQVSAAMHGYKAGEIIRNLDHWNIMLRLDLQH